MRTFVILFALLLAGAAGCGRSQHESITNYCRGRLGCGIDPGGSEPELNACVDKYENPTGTAPEQCYAIHLAACLGDCFKDHGGCAIFDVNDPCNCELEDYGCPQ
jgi:hypothetical protein